jgi:hypothetical protein
VVRAGLKKPATGAGITDTSLPHGRLLAAPNLIRPHYRIRRQPLATEYWRTNGVVARRDFEHGRPEISSRLCVKHRLPPSGLAHRTGPVHVPGAPARELALKLRLGLVKFREHAHRGREYASLHNLISVIASAGLPGPVRSRAAPTVVSRWRTWLVRMACLVPSWRAACGRLGWPGRVRSLRMRCSAPGRVKTFQTSVVNAPGPPRAARGFRGKAGVPGVGLLRGRRGRRWWRAGRRWRRRAARRG